MPAFILHVAAVLLLIVAATHWFSRRERRHEDRLRLGLVAFALWTIGDLVAQWAALGPPW